MNAYQKYTEIMGANPDMKCGSKVIVRFAARLSGYIGRRGTVDSVYISPLNVACARVQMQDTGLVELFIQDELVVYGAEAI